MPKPYSQQGEMRRFLEERQYSVEDMQGIAEALAAALPQIDKEGNNAVCFALLAGLHRCAGMARNMVPLILLEGDEESPRRQFVVAEDWLAKTLGEDYRYVERNTTFDTFDKWTREWRKRWVAYMIAELRLEIARRGHADGK